MISPNVALPASVASTTANRNDIGLCRQMGHDLRQSLHGLGMLAGVLVLQATDDAARETLGYIQDALADLQQTLDHYTALARQAGPHPLLQDAMRVVVGDRPLPIVDILRSNSAAHVVRYGSVESYLSDASRPRPPACLVGLPTADTLAPVLGCLLAFKGNLPNTSVILIPPEAPSPWLRAVSELGGLSLLEPQPDPLLLQQHLGVSLSPVTLDFDDADA